MAYLFRTLTALAWALWLGALIALFLFVQTMFRQDRPTAVVAAPMLFNAFEKYQMVLAAAGIVGTLGLILVVRSRLAVPLLLVFLLSIAGGIYSTVAITAKMNAMREQGLSGSPEFRKLHGYSSMIYVTEAGLLFVGGLLLPSLMREPRTTRDVAQKEPTD